MVFATALFWSAPAPGHCTLGLVGATATSGEPGILRRLGRSGASSVGVLVLVASRGLGVLLPPTQLLSTVLIGFVVMVGGVIGHVVGYLSFDCILVGLVGCVGLLLLFSPVSWVVPIGS